MTLSIQGELNLSNKGMGKIKLIGKISTGNLRVDGSQIIIRDIEDITKDNFDTNPEVLTNTDGDNIIIKALLKESMSADVKVLILRVPKSLKRRTGFSTIPVRLHFPLRRISQR